MKLFDFLFNSGLFHWFSAFAGIVIFQLVRLIPLRKQIAANWVGRNVIPIIWSMFWLSIGSMLLHEYVSGFSPTLAFFTGYVGTHLIFRLTKPVYLRPVSGKHIHRYNLPRV
jgi:hypothetical protein